MHGNSTHGCFSGGKPTPEYMAYWNMRGRCTKASKHNFDRYGGRGITMCAQWQGAGGFETFLADMGARPPGCTLERVDNEAGYSPTNCVWATKKRQARNKSTTKRVVHNGAEEVLADLAEASGLRPKLVRERVYRYGMPVHEALSLPVLSHSEVRQRRV